MTICSPNILVTGANGQLATALFHHPLTKHHAVTVCTRDVLDITNKDSIAAALKHYRPDIVINMAAYVKIDKAEEEKSLAAQSNQVGAEYLAIACNAAHIPLIQLSTDYLFDGLKTTPYCEEDKPNPINFYGESKWLGEEAIRKHCPHHLILRVSGIFSEYGHNFLKTMLKLGQERNELRVVADQITCPTYASDIVTMLYALVKQPLQVGTYHYCSKEPTSWYEFACAILSEAKRYQPLSVTVTAVTTEEYKTPAKRPAYSVLQCDKIHRIYGITQPSWREGVNQIVAALAKT